MFAYIYSFTLALIGLILLLIIYMRQESNEDLKGKNTQSKVDNSSDFGDLHTKREETQSFKLLPEISEESIEVGLSDLKFSKETLREGEDVKVYATIINKKDRLRNKAVVFYYVPNAVDDEEDLSQYAQEKFEIYREFIDNLGRGETKEIVFDWAVKKDAKTIFVQAEKPYVKKQYEPVKKEEPPESTKWLLISFFTFFLSLICWLSGILVPVAIILFIAFIYAQIRFWYSTKTQ